MYTDLLVDSQEFWSALADDLSRARHAALLQTFSFEGDSVGLELATALRDCPVDDRRLLVDSYTRINQNDRWIPAPSTLWDGEFRREIRSTRSAIRALRRAGVQVRWGMPLGLLGLRLLRRDHKKLNVFDDRVAYLGGINFAEHNFAWHDFMVRIEDREVAGFLRTDFEASWNRRSRTRTARFGSLDLHLIGGRGAGPVFRKVLDRLDQARERVVVVSPYVSPPFTWHLGRLTARGVEVTVLTPEHNNKPLLKALLLSEARRHGFQVRLFPDRMLHMKAILVDDDRLVFGSSNFDLMGRLGLLNEIVAISSDRTLVGQFRSRVLRPALAVSQAVTPWEVPATATLGLVGRHRIRQSPISTAESGPREGLPVPPPMGDLPAGEWA